jgi:hypothetical protein
LKVALVDDKGGRGSVEHSLTATVNAVEGIEVSDLLLVDLSIHPESPIVVYDAGSGLLGGHAEIYADRTQVENVSARLEIATTQSGHALVDAPARIEKTSHPERWLARGALQTASLAPGPYVARVVLMRNDELIGHVLRPFRLGHSPTTSLDEDQASSPLDAFLKRVGHWVLDYEQKFSAVVAEERYMQIERRGPVNFAVPIPDASSSSWTHKSVKFLERREVRSDVLLVRTGEDWLGFRDVFEVNGKAIRSRDKRLEKLFLSPSPDNRKQVQRIAAESARYNLGGVYRNFNVPTLPVLFLHPRFQHRFEFKKAGEGTVDGVSTWVLEYKEQKAPTFIKTAEGDNIYAAGKLWIDPLGGKVVQTELVLETRRTNIKCVAEVTYRNELKSGLWVPYEMRERYGWMGYANAAYTECLATYSNFRQFTVEAKEQVR